MGIALAAVALILAAQQPRAPLSNPPSPPIPKPPKPPKPKPPAPPAPPGPDEHDHNGVLGGIQATVFGADRRYAFGVLAPLNTGPDGVINAFDRASWSNIDLRAAPPVNSTSEAWLGEATWSPGLGQSVEPPLHFGGLVITMLQGPLTP